MWHRYCIFLLLAAWFFTVTHASAATNLTVTSADKTYVYTLRRDTTWHSIVTSTPLQLVVEGAKQYAVFFRLAPPDLRTIYTGLEARLFVDHADAHMIPALVQGPSALQSIYTNLEARIFVDHADTHFVPVLIPIVLDNGVPTSTVARNISAGKPSETIQSRIDSTSVQPSTPTRSPHPATPVAEEGTPRSTVVIESTSEPNGTPTTTP